MSWAITQSGKGIDLNHITADDIDIHDIAVSLSRQYRYLGHSLLLFTVAQHSVIVSSLVPAELRVHALLHDAHEAYMGDITAPVKAFIKHHAGFPDVIEKLETKIDHAIWGHFGLRHLTPLEKSVIKYADLKVLAAERRDLFKDFTYEKDEDNPWCDYWLPPASPVKHILPLDIDKSCDLFLNKSKEYGLV
jgi:uncharacterized protein